MYAHIHAYTYTHGFTHVYTCTLKDSHSHAPTGVFILVAKTSLTLRTEIQCSWMEISSRKYFNYPVSPKFLII